MAQDLSHPAIFLERTKWVPAEQTRSAHQANGKYLICIFVLVPLKIMVFLNHHIVSIWHHHRYFKSGIYDPQRTVLKWLKFMLTMFSHQVGQSRSFSANSGFVPLGKSYTCYCKAIVWVCMQSAPDSQEAVFSWSSDCKFTESENSWGWKGPVEGTHLVQPTCSSRAT